MSKSKTVLKFVISTFFLVGSATVFILYFPSVTLGIKLGIAVSAAPLAIFAISAMVALVSAITLITLVVSEICHNGKSNQPGGESIGNLVKVAETPQPETVVVGQTEKSLSSLPPYPEPTPMNDMHRSESLASLPFTADDVRYRAFYDFSDYPDEKFSLPTRARSCPNLNQNLSPGDELKACGLRVEIKRMDLLDYSAFPSHSSSPLSSFDQSQPFPSLPSIVVDRHNSSRGDSNFVQNHGSFQMHDQLRVALGGFHNGIEVGRSKCAEIIRALIPLMRLPSNSINEENQGYESLPISQTTPYLSDFRSLPNTKQTVTVEQQNVEEEFGEQEIQAGYSSTMTDSCSSWGTNWDDDSMMSLSLHQHTLSFGMPLIAEESAQSDQNTNNEEVPNDFGFYVSSTGHPLYGNIESPNSVVLEYSTQDQNIESGPSAMLWNVNNQQYLSIQSLSDSINRSDVERI